MPQRKGTVGTGMTERVVVSLDAENPDNLKAMLDAVVFSSRLSSFQLLSGEIAKLSRQILAQAGLPHNVDGRYAVHRGGADASNNGEPRGEPSFTFAELFVTLGIGSDSPEGYAARALMQIDEAMKTLGRGQVDEAMAMAFALGELVREAGIKAVWEADALRGEKVIQSAREGHRSVYGTPEARAACWAACAGAFEEELAKGTARMEAYDLVADRLKVSVRTVQRAVASSRR